MTPIIAKRVPRVLSFTLLVSVSVSACARAGQPEAEPPTAEPEVPAAPTAGLELGPELGPDRNFGCTLEPSALEPWRAPGMDVPESTRDQFALWMTMDTSEIPPELSSSCTNAPSGGKYSPVQPAGSGGVSRADVVVATTDVIVYRAFSSTTFECGVASPAAEFGSWWSLAEPQAPKPAYRQSLAICQAWNDLSMITTCTLKAGTVVLVGATQSATCAGSSTCDPAPDGWNDPLPATEAPQLFVNTYTEAGRRSDAQLQEFLLDCSTAAWDG